MISPGILILRPGVSSNPGKGRRRRGGARGALPLTQGTARFPPSAPSGPPRSPPRTRSCGPAGRLVMYMHCGCHATLARNGLSMTRYRPSYDEFARLLDSSASCVPVYRQLTGDGLTPVSAFRRIERTAPSFLFESVIGGEKVGRFSFLGTEPFLRFEARGPEVTIVETGREAGGPPVHLRRPLRRAPEAARAAIGPPPRRACPGSPAARSASPLMTPCATPRTCPPPRRTTAACPTSRSPSTTAWSCSTTSARPSWSSRRRTSDPASDPRAAYQRRLRPRRRAGRPARGPVARPGRLRHRHRHAAHAANSGRTSPASGTRTSSATARNTSRRATSSRWCPASGSRSRPAPSRSTSTACCGSSIPARSSSISPSAISR